MSVICAIAGGSGAGKTTLAVKVMDLLSGGADVGAGRRPCDHIAIDWYYRDLRHITMEERKAVNYDHPDSLEFELFGIHLDELRAGRDVEAPVYDFATHTRNAETRLVEASPIVVTEGILLLAVDAVRPKYDFSVFIDVPEAVRLERRIHRDCAERGRDKDDIVRQWNEFVKPMHHALVQPSMATADRIVGCDEDLDEVAAELAARLTSRAHD